MNRKAEQKESTRGAILASAARLLRARGITAASVAEVMKGAGLTVGGFYAHFASKEALVDETLRRTGAAMRARLLARIDDSPVADRAEVIVKRYLSARHRDAPDEGCALPAVVGEIGATAGQHGTAIAEQLDALADVLAPHLPAAHEGTSRRHVALALVALMYGGLSLARAVRGTPLSDELLRACRALARTAVHGGGRRTT